MSNPRNSPAVSVGIPFTDQGEQLRWAIQSVLDQSFDDFELILLGDGPDEATLAVARQFDDSRIRLLVNAKREGLPRALNRLSRESAGRYCARMDGDDIMHPERLSRQFRYCEDHPEVDLVGSHAYLIDEHNQVVGQFAEPELPATADGYFNSNAFTHPTVFGKRSWFLANPFDEALLRGEDKELWMRTQGFSVFRKMPENLMFYRAPRRVRYRRRARDYAFDRMVLRKCAHLGGRYSWARSMLRSYAKQLVLAGMACTGTTSRLYSRRWTPIASEEMRAAEEIVDRVTRRGPIGKMVAVTVTYGDRSSLVGETVASALRAGVDEVVVVDNGTTGDAQVSLYETLSQYSNVSTVRNEQNAGSSVGFSAGLTAALSRSARYIWLLDDDNLVTEGRATDLAVLLATTENTVAVAARRTVDPVHERVLSGMRPELAYPPSGSFIYLDVLQRLQRRFSARGRQRRTDMPKSIPVAPYGGLMITADLLARVGYPRADFRLYEDDTEWTSRFAQVGEILLTERVSITDADGKWSDQQSGGLAGMLASTSKTRLYYSVRNRVVFDRTNSQGLVGSMRYAINKFVYITYARMIASKTGHGSSLAILEQAVRDGEAGRLNDGPSLV